MMIKFDEQAFQQKESEETVTTETLVTSEEVIETLKAQYEELKEKYNIIYEDICTKESQINQIELEGVLKAHDEFQSSLGNECDNDGLGTSKARRAILDGMNLSDLDLCGANLEYACMADTFLDSVNLREARLQGADLREAWLDSVDLRGADLTGAHLHGARLADADLRGADMRKADLSCANLCGARMEGANLAGSDMSKADLSFVDWWGADFNGVDLRSARNLDALDVLAAIAAAHGMSNEALEYSELQAIANEFADTCPRLSVPELACEILILVGLIKKIVLHDLIDDEPFMFPTFMRLLHKTVKPRLDVVLEDFGNNKIDAIKVIREITGLGLKEAKALVESAPTPIKKSVDEDEALELKEKLEIVGCTVVLE